LDHVSAYWACLDTNKVMKIPFQKMTSLSAWPVVTVDAWDLADPISSDGENFADSDWLSWACSIIHLNFVQFFLISTAFLDVYSTKNTNLFHINHRVIVISGSTIYRPPFQQSDSLSENNGNKICDPDRFRLITPKQQNLDSTNHSILYCVQHIILNRLFYSQQFVIVIHSLYWLRTLSYYVVLQKAH